MIRFPTQIVIFAFILAFSGVQGAEAVGTESELAGKDDTIYVDLGLNITNPLDEIVVKVPGDTDQDFIPADGIVVDVAGEYDDDLEPLNDIIPDFKDPVEEVPENLTFHKEHTGLQGISQGTTYSLISSPSIISSGIGPGAKKAESIVPTSAKKGTTAGTAILTSIIGQPVKSILPNNPAQQPVEPANMKVSSNQFVATTMVGFLIMAFASVVSARSGSGKMYPFFVPLYSRISRDEVLENETRGNIYRLIAHQPGMDLISIKKSLNLSNGVIAHHIHTLEREKYLRSVRDGRYRRFFVSGTKVELIHSVEKIILKEIESYPSINQTQIAKNLGLSRQALNYHIQKLVKNGAIVTEKIGRETHCRRRDN